MALDGTDLVKEDLSSRMTPGEDPTDVERHESSSTNAKLQSPINSLTPITYHYLIFETALPSHTCHTTSSTVLPSRPNLKRYTDPREWPESKKRVILIILCIATNFASFAAGSYASGAKQMKAEWGQSQAAISVGITTFCTGFAIAPMVLAPFSEINGRYPVLVWGGVFFVIGQLGCAITRSYTGMILARFTTGVGASVFSTLVGGVIADIYDNARRNTPMALFSGFAVFGTGMGPLVCGFVAQNTTWRWIFRIQGIICGVLTIVVMVFLPETRGSILLSHKAKLLNAWYQELEDAGQFGFNVPVGEKLEAQRIRWKVQADEERLSLRKMITDSVYRPFFLLFTEPVVFFFSLWASFAWAILYLTFGSIPLIFNKSYGFDLQQSNSVFASMCIGTIFATTYSIYQDRMLLRFVKPNSNQNPTFLHKATDLSCPEARLYFACLQSILLPAGLFWFGWSQGSSHWISPTIAIGSATMGIYSIYLATFNYLADSYGQYSSSALAAQSFCRNMLGGIFPLFTIRMFTKLTFHGAASLLGALAVILTAVPWVLVFYGPQIRARSRFAFGLI